MKLFSLFTVGLVAGSERGRPETIDADARLAKLAGLVTTCMADSFFDGPKRHRMTRKFNKLQEIAANYLVKVGNRIIEDDTDDTRINAGDPCSCLGGAAGGYKSFFNRLARAHGFVDENDNVTEQAGQRHGYRRHQAKRIQERLLNYNLNEHFGCDLPN